MFFLCLPIYIMSSILDAKFKQQMQKAEQSQPSSLSFSSFRTSVLPLFTLNTAMHHPSLSIFQLVLQTFNYIQMLKFPIDYCSQTWFGSQTSIFMYLDYCYSIDQLSQEAKSTLIVTLIVLMNMYYLVQIFVKLIGVQLTPWMITTRKILFLLYKYVFLMPLFRIIISMFVQCPSAQSFLFCLPSVPLLLQIVFIASYTILFLFILVQTWLNFEFLPLDKQYTRTRKSSQISVMFMFYFILNQIAVTSVPGIASMITLTSFALIFAGIIIWKEEQIQEKAKLLQFASIGVIVLGFLLDITMQIFSKKIQFYVFILLAIVLVVTVLQLKTYSIRFELENINKWPTQDIMIRQQSTIRYYLSRGSQYLFKVWIHGYMQIHRQKCDNLTCPSRYKLLDKDKQLLATMGEQNQQLLRINNIMKVIFTAGYKLDPVPPEIQLQFCIYKLQRKQYEFALRKLLMIDIDELSLDRYYVYTYLKGMLSQIIMENSEKQFLDLVTEMTLKRQEQSLMKDFQKAAFLNLQFWSILNDDHPDFQKLNQVSLQRIQIKKQIHNQFASITSYSHSQKLTTIYTNYLECLQNDEQFHHEIYANLEKEYKLNQQILVQDWSNSSTNIMLVALEENNYGKIIEINSSCAGLFGYQKHQLINQTLTNLFIDQLKQHSNDLLQPNTSPQLVLLLNKSAYLTLVTKKARTCTSMTHGSTALIIFEQDLRPQACHLIVNENNKIIGHSAAVLAVVGLDLKAYEGEHFTYQFFNTNFTEKNDNYYKLEELVKTDLVRKNINPQLSFDFTVQPLHKCKIIQISYMKAEMTVKGERTKPNRFNSFKFQVQVNLTQFKYIGKCDNEESYISQFSNFLGKNTLLEEQKKINYAQDISTVRLKDNVIQLIEDGGDDTQNQLFIKKEDGSQQAIVVMSRKDEEEIFGSRGAFQQFLGKQKIGKYVMPFLLLACLIIFSFYIVTFVIQTNNASNAESLAVQTVYQCQIYGLVAQLSRYISQFRLAAQNKSAISPETLIHQFNQILYFLQRIHLKGSLPYQIQFKVNGQTMTYLTSQYYSNMINYANALSVALTNVTTNSELASVLANMDTYTINFILTGSTTRITLRTAFLKREDQITDIIQGQSAVQKFLLALGLVIILLIAAAIILGLYFMNQERQKVFEIFLLLSEIQLQKFSSKTQKFLISIHEEENNGDLNAQEDQNGKKTHSSSFAKKKSFKQIKSSLFFYLKLCIVLLIMAAFPIQAYIFSVSESQFQWQSIEYIKLTSSLQSSLARSAEVLLKISLYGTFYNMQRQGEWLRAAYRSERDSSEVAFGNIDNFNSVYQAFQNSDICQGSQTAFGLVSIPDSCQLGDLSTNGTFLIMTNLVTRIREWTANSSLDPIPHIQFEVLALAQRILVQKILMAQEEVIQYVHGRLLGAMMVWISISILAALIIWGYEVSKFVRQLNLIRSILGLLPLRLIKENQLALKYVKKLLERSDQT